MERTEVEKRVSDLKSLIKKTLAGQKYETTLKLVSLCARILYDTNIYYMDQELEQVLRQIAFAILPSEACTNNMAAVDSDTVLFYDGFGLDNRGLAKIYLKALGEKKKICYVTYQNRSQEIPEILNMIRSFGGSAYFLEAGEKSSQIHQLNAILKQSNAEHFFLYTNPDDVVATTLLYRYEGLLKRYQINLTDHAFWLGAGCIDVCIEFRDYGGSVSSEYRHIPQGKITLLPFYPNIERSQSFQGFPFPVKPDSKVIFSGGALYKTLGKGNKYYEIVDYLLSKHEQAVFWYAGTGDDSQMKKLMAKYPDRLFLTPERKDLFQVLQNCYFYLSTYPICGGLMYQYAACAGKAPLTLRAGGTNDGFLLNQDALGIEFESMEDLKREIDRFMEDEDYAARKNAEMINCVISQEAFQQELLHILASGSTSLRLNYKHMDTEAFRQIYLERITSQRLNRYYAARDMVWFMLPYFPVQFLMGAYHKVCKKIGFIR